MFPFCTSHAKVCSHYKVETSRRLELESLTQVEMAN
jgi:hypothetical protein